MATLTVQKTYSNNAILDAADLDAIIDSVETLINTTQLNDDNIQNSGITASSKLKTASVTEDKIAASAVTTGKLLDLSLTTEKFDTSAITTAKLKDNEIKKEKFADLISVAKVGTTVMFHNFNNTVNLPIPRGWMKCDGSLIDQTAYNALHGSGAYTADEIATSPLLGKYVPNMVARYPIGVSDTTKTGASAINSVGNANNTFSMSHTHTVNAHTHSVTGEYLVNIAPGTATRVANQSPLATGNAVNLTTSSGSPASPDIRPESIEFIYIIKVV